MTTPTELLDRYTEAYHQRDEATFRSMVAEGCVRHDPGATITISRDDNVARFRAFHEQFPGARFSYGGIWEHGDDTITACYTIECGETVLSGIEVFRFVDGAIVEVWNAPAGKGAW